MAPPTRSPPAVVVFAGRAELGWLRLLKPGFRHCFAAVWDGRTWVMLDPLSHATELQSLGVGADFDMAGWFAERGYTAVCVPPRPVVRRPAPWAPFTCVEAVKRLLGIRARAAVTPWRLYRHLKAEIAA